MRLSEATRARYTEEVTDQAKRILCIEDDTFLINLIIEKFTHANILATRAATGGAGVSAAISDIPDLILLDLMLPDMPGLDVLEMLKQSSVTAHIPVIIFSNLADKPVIEDALAHGALMYLVKSNTLPGELVDIVTSELELY